MNGMKQRGGLSGRWLCFSVYVSVLLCCPCALPLHVSFLPFYLQAVRSGRLSSDPSSVRDALCGVLVEVWQRLRWCASTRGKLRDVRRLMEVELDTGVASSTSPLLRQVLSKILLQVRVGARKPGCLGVSE